MNRLEHIPVDRRTEIRSQPLLRQMCAFKPLAGCQPLSKGNVNILSHSYNSLSHTLPLPPHPNVLFSASTLGLLQPHLPGYAWVLRVVFHRHCQSVLWDALSVQGPVDSDDPCLGCAWQVR